MSAKRSHKPRALGPAWWPVHRRREQGPELQRPVRKSRENEQRGVLTREIFASFDRTTAELPDRHSHNNKQELWLRSVGNSFPKWIILDSVRWGTETGSHCCQWGEIRGHWPSGCHRYKETGTEERTVRKQQRVREDPVLIGLANCDSNIR